jgi:hypothetical protein
MTFDWRSGRKDRDQQIAALRKKIAEMKAEKDEK